MNSRKLLLLFMPFFLFPLLLNWQRLFDPPYWDAITGIYTQGVWLYRHHFNYAELARLPHFMEGGPNINLFYVFSPLYAILLHYFQLRFVFLFLHLLILFCAGLVAMLFFRIMHAEYSWWLALSWCLTAMLNPIWSGQTASLYVEIPLAACVAIAIYGVWKDRYILAAVGCLAGYTMKGSALIFALACAVYVLILAIGKRQHCAWAQRFRPQAWILLVPLPLMIFLNHWAPVPTAIVPDIWGNFIYFFVKARLQYPLVAVELIGVLFFIFFKLFTSSWPQDAFTLFLTLVVGTFWLGYIFNSLPIPRYMVMIIFPLMCLLARLTAPRKSVGAFIAVTLIATSLITGHGRGFPVIPDHRGGRSGSELERSREYLIDLDSNRALCAYLETRAFEQIIVTKSPFTQMLTIPEFGYVKKALPYIVEAGRFSTLCPALPLGAFLQRPGPHRTLCVYSPNIDELHWGPSLKPNANDHIILTDQTLPAPIIVYAREWKV